VGISRPPQNCSPGPWVTNTFQLSDDFSIIHGKHQIAFGANWIHETLNSDGQFSVNGNFTFAGSVTGNGLADFLIGRPSNFSQNNGQIGSDRLNIPSAYVQDNVQVNSHLRVNAGLRWEPTLPNTDKYGRGTYLDPARFDAGQVSSVAI